MKWKVLAGFQVIWFFPPYFWTNIAASIHSSLYPLLSASPLHSCPHHHVPPSLTSSSFSLRASLIPSRRTSYLSHFPSFFLTPPFPLCLLPPLFASPPLYPLPLFLFSPRRQKGSASSIYAFRAPRGWMSEREPNAINLSTSLAGKKSAVWKKKCDGLDAFLSLSPAFPLFLPPFLLLLFFLRLLRRFLLLPVLLFPSRLAVVCRHIKRSFPLMTCILTMNFLFFIFYPHLPRKSSALFTNNLPNYFFFPSAIFIHFLPVICFLQHY